MFLVRHDRMLSKDSKTHDQKYLFMTYWSQNDGGGQSVKPKALKGAMYKKKKTFHCYMRLCTRRTPKQTSYLQGVSTTEHTRT